MSVWSSSLPLKKIRGVLEEQQRILDQLKAYLEVRLAPFQRHVGEQRRNVYHALRHVESRLGPVREYFQGEQRNLEQMTADLKARLGAAFEHDLPLYKDLLEEINQRIERECRSFQAYLEDERQAVERVHRDLEERLDRLIQNLAEQREIVGSLCEPEVMSEYEALAEYLAERQQILGRYIRFPGYRPETLFSQLAEVADRQTHLHRDRGRLFSRVFEETRLADGRLRQALRGGPTTTDRSPA